MIENNEAIRDDAIKVVVDALKVWKGWLRDLSVQIELDDNLI